MTTAILTILAALIPLLVWWIKRRAEKKADPNEQHKARYQQIDQDVSGIGQSRRDYDLTVHGRADLDELERLQRAKGDRDSR